MNRIRTIALNTFRECIRDKILYNLILFALIMILSSIMLGQLTLGNEVKVILDLGLASISIFGTLIAIFIGIGLVYKELEKRTVYALFAKPVHRHELIIGKYFGLLLTLLVNTSIMTAGLELALLYHGRIGFIGHMLLLPAVYLVFLSLALVTALALLFSTFSTPALSAVFSFFLWVIGHFNKDLLRFGEISKAPYIKWLCRGLYYVIPNFSTFNVMGSRNIIQNAPYYRPADFQAILGASIYCFLYCAIVISLSILIFMRRDFK